MTEKLTTDQRIRAGKPIEIWTTPDGSWTWEVYKKYQKPAGESKNPYARWFCRVKSPFVPQGELGDVYVNEITKYARKVFDDTALAKKKTEELM
jgi:hypothetical protein